MCRRLLLERCVRPVPADGHCYRRSRAAYYILCTYRQHLETVTGTRTGSSISPAPSTRTRPLLSTVYHRHRYIPSSALSVELLSPSVAYIVLFCLSIARHETQVLHRARGKSRSALHQPSVTVTIDKPPENPLHGQHQASTGARAVALATRVAVAQQALVQR